jgi:competence protein ComGC
MRILEVMIIIIIISILVFVGVKQIKKSINHPEDRSVKSCSIGGELK